MINKIKQMWGLTPMIAKIGGLILLITGIIYAIIKYI
jgi:hypothetical protein